MQKSIKGSFGLTAGIFIIIGLVLLIFPGIALSLACIIIGIVALVYGIMRIVNYTKDSSAAPALDLVIGLALAIFGVVLIFVPNFFSGLISIVLGIYFVVEGFADAKRALDMKKAGYSKWVIPFVIALVVVALGVLIIVNPVATWLVRILGIAMIVEGVSTAFSTVAVKK